MPPHALVQATPILAAPLRARAMPAPRQETTPAPDLRQMTPAVVPAESRSCADKPRHCEERLRRSNPDSVPPTLDCFVASLLAMTKKGKRNAERRCSTTTASCDAARARAGALASRRPTTALAAATERHRSARATRLPGTRSARPPRWFERRSASQHTTRSRQPASMRHSRALPAPCCPSPARLHPQSGHDAVRACLAQAARARR